jgi:hypothetical protein
MEHALEDCRRHEVNRNLQAALTRVAVDEPHGPLAAAFAEVRSARGYAAQSAAMDALHEAIESAGLLATRDGLVSTAVRLLGPGSDTVIDRTAHLLNKAWRRLRRRLGTEVDPRVFAAVAVQYEPARRRLAAAFAGSRGGNAPDAAELYALVQRLLLPDCPDSCRECLDNPSRFGGLYRPSRALSKRWLGAGPPTIAATPGQTAQWSAQAHASLSRDHRARIIVPPAAAGDLASLLLDLLTTEQEMDGLLAPIAVDRVARDGTSWIVDLGVKGATHE